jgi:hypothetical protein
MEKDNPNTSQQRAAGDASVPQVPPEWQVTVRRITLEDGRYLIYYDFAPSSEAPEIKLTT